MVSALAPMMIAHFELYNSNLFPSTIPGIQDLLMVCRSQKVIKEKKDMLMGWLKNQPSEILKNAKTSNKGVTESEYLNDLHKSLRSRFQKRILQDHRSFDSDLIILRYAAHLQQQALDQRSSSTQRGQGRVMKALRPVETLVEESLRVSQDPDPSPPDEVHKFLGGCRSFFPVYQDNEEDEDKDDEVDEDEDDEVDEDKDDEDNGNDKDEDSNDSEDDILHFRVASLQGTRSVTHRLILRLPYCSIWVHHHPMEVYITWGLHTISHVYENLGHGMKTNKKLPLPSQSVFIVGDACEQACFPDTFMVCRPGSTIYDSCFPPEMFSFPLERFLDFMFRNGKPEKARSNGWRVNLGCAGLAHDSTTTSSFRPRTLYGESLFTKDKDGEFVRCVLGNLVDGLCDAAILMARHMDKPHILNHLRFVEYADHLRRFLYAKRFFAENITIQLMCLSNGHNGKEHCDQFNDPRAGYDRCFAKVINLVDKIGKLWSLKIIVSFRKRIGDFYSTKFSTINQIMVNIRTMLGGVDDAYRRLTAHHRGSHHGYTIPTWNNVNPLFLDDDCPWEKVVLRNNLIQEQLIVVTGIFRSLWLSCPICRIYHMSHRLTESGMVQMFIVMSWQNSFSHYWEICQRMDHGNIDAYPIFEYYRVAKSLFSIEKKNKGQEMYGGGDPRFGPIAFDFASSFGTHEEPKKVVVDNICGAILCLCDDINRQADSGEAFSMAAMQSMLQRCNEEIKQVAKCELGLFRLMILLQGLAILGVRLKPGIHLKEMCFPVPGSGSWNHIKGFQVEDKHVEDVCHEIRNLLSTPSIPIGMDCVESGLCEGVPGRSLTKFDIFVKGQSLFLLGDDGVGRVKFYGAYEWENVVKRFATSTDA